VSLGTEEKASYPSHTVMSNANNNMLSLVTRLSFSIFDYRAKSRKAVFVCLMGLAKRELPGTAVQEV
jgi:hypothetical protein